MKLQRYDTALNRAEWAQEIFAGSFYSSKLIGASDDEAQELAMVVLEKALRNESYYRSRNFIVRYGTAGYYAENAGKFGRGVAWTVDLINPVEDILTIGDLSEDAAVLWGEGRKSAPPGFSRPSGQCATIL